MNLLKKNQQTGWRYSIAILFNRIVPARVFRMRRFVVYRIAVAEPSGDQPIAPNANASISISRCVDEADIASVEQMTYFQRSCTTGDSIAYAAKLNDQPAAGMWAATECFDEHELGVRIDLDENQAWLFAALVPKQFRRRGIYSQLLNFTVADMAKQGYDDQLVAVNPDNIGSNRIHKSVSRETVGQVLAIRFWKTTCCWAWGNVSKDATIRWNSTKHPISIRCKAL